MFEIRVIWRLVQYKSY